MFLGLRTTIYRVKTSDLGKAKEWYAQVFGKKPYFDEPFYVGFNIGGFELGLEPVDEKLVHGNTTYSYWGVENIEAAFAHCAKTATIDSAIKNVGGEIKVGSVKDPFGNIIGLIENPGFKLET